MFNKILQVIVVLFFQFTCSYSQTIDRLPCVDKKFSVAVHIFKDSLGSANISESTIQANFDQLNQNFLPICVSFEICEFIYHSNFKYDSLNNVSEPDEWQEVQNLYNLEHRINIYFVNKIINPAGKCGFAGLGQITNLTSSGVVIQKTSGCCDGPYNVIIHEFGHYFGLEHTFETGSGLELADGSNALTAGDQIADTPADPFVDGDDVATYVDDNCRFISMKKDANNQYYSPLVGNMMSYYPATCGCGFTHDQYMKMAKTYLQQIGMW